MRTLLAISALSIITACSHPLEIVGEGDILSASGTRACLLENYVSADPSCTENFVVSDYSETYFATPRSGWQFDHWENYCTDSSENQCSFDFTASEVEKFWGFTAPPLIAVFAADNGIPMSATIDVDGRLWAQVELFKGVTWNEVEAACPAGICNGVLNGYDVSGWAWGTVTELNNLFNFSIGSYEIGPGPDFYFEFNSAWAPNFFSSGWTPTLIDFGDLFIQGHVATSFDATQAYRAELVDDTADGVRTDTLVEKDTGGDDTGAWLYQLQALNDTITVNGRVWAQPDLFTNLSWNQIIAQCPAGVCEEGAVLNGLYTVGWTLASVEDVNALFNHYIGDDVMGPGPDSLTAPYTSAWGGRIFRGGFRPTLGPSAIEGVLLDVVEPGSDRVRVGVLSNSTNSGEPDNARTYGSHGKSDAYGFAGAWFYRPGSTTDESVIALGREWAQPSLFTNLSWFDIAAVCPTDGACAGTLNGLDVSGWQWAKVDDVNALLNSYGVTPPLSGAGDSSEGPNLGWYSNFAAAGFKPTIDWPDRQEARGWTAEREDEDGDTYNAYLAFMQLEIFEEEEIVDEYDSAGGFLADAEIGYANTGAWLYRLAD